MRHQDELEQLLERSTGPTGDPLASVLQRLADLPAHSTPTPTRRLAAVLDGVDEDEGLGARIAGPTRAVGSVQWHGGGLSAVAGAGSRPRWRARPASASGWLLRLAVGTSGLLLAGSAAVAASRHSDTPADQGRVHPHVVVKHPDGSPAHGSGAGASPTHPGGALSSDAHTGSAGHGHASAPATGHRAGADVPTPPSLAPPPAADGQRGATGSVDGTHRAGGTGDGAGTGNGTGTGSGDGTGTANGTDGSRGTSGGSGSGGIGGTDAGGSGGSGGTPTDGAGGSGGTPTDGGGGSTGAVPGTEPGSSVGQPASHESPAGPAQPLTGG